MIQRVWVYPTDYLFASMSKKARRNSSRKTRMAKIFTLFFSQRGVGSGLLKQSQHTQPRWKPVPCVQCIQTQGQGTSYKAGTCAEKCGNA